MGTLERVINELKKEIPQFEIRTEQKEMMEATYEAMTNEGKLAVHAPTGTGKSLGYLVPAVAAKMTNPSFRMSISTFTLSLQDQLIHDLELMEKIYKRLTGRTLHTVVLKGKQNYICEKNFYEAAVEDELPIGVVDKVKKGLERLKGEGLSLDRQSLGVKTTAGQWEFITPSTCTGEACPFHRECTFFEHHGRLAQADFIATNHSLFFKRHFFVKDAWSDVTFQVFDEAHKLEPVLLGAQTFDLSNEVIRNWVFRGANLAKKYQIPEDQVDTFVQTFLLENETIRSFYAYSTQIGSAFSKPSVAFDKLGESEVVFKEMVHRIASWSQEMYRYFVQEFVTDEFKKRKDFSSFREQFKFWASSLMGLKEFTRIYFSATAPGVLWCEKTKRGDVVFHVTVRSIDDIEDIFPKPLLLTSGTLAVQGSCLPYATRIHADVDRELVLKTPFDLTSKSIVYVSEKANPKERTHYETHLHQEISDLLELGDRKSFVLFTSKEQMKRSYELLTPHLQERSAARGETLDVWIQDDENGNAVLSSFQNPDRRSILFGTLKYFEGIDLKRDALTQVILTKLPFANPDHPIQEILGQNHEYANWEALVRFEQAFGRLIRTQGDYGSFAILDNRVSKPFFRQFLELFQHEGIQVTSDLHDIATFYQQQKDH